MQVDRDGIVFNSTQTCYRNWYKYDFLGENNALQVGDAATLGIDEYDGNNLQNEYIN